MCGLENYLPHIKSQKALFELCGTQFPAFDNSPIKIHIIKKLGAVLPRARE